MLAGFAAVLLEGDSVYSQFALERLGFIVARTGTCRYRIDHGTDANVVSCY